jgi:hypothetical protein
MRRWARYEAPIMVCVDLSDDGYTGKVALNLTRLDAHWSGQAPDRSRTSQLERLAYTLAA